MFTQSTPQPLNSAPIILSNKRIYGLDILRAFAILSVVFSHGIGILSERLWDILWLVDYDGVSVFFVLSGFLIGTILIRTLEKEEASFKTLFNFMYKRWFRTLPLYYLVLGFLTLYFVFQTGIIDVRRIASYMLFVQNLFTPHPDFFPEAWSLAVEEWFYLLVPFSTFCFVRFGRLKPQNAILVIIILMATLIPCIRFYKSQTIYIDTMVKWDMIFRKQVFTRLDASVFGLLGAYINFYYNEYWNKWKGVTFILGLVIFFGVRYSFYFLDLLGGINGVYFNVFSFSITSIGVLLTLPFMNNLKHGEGILYKFITFISLISYSMYLVNYVVVQDIILPYTLPDFNAWWLPYVKYGMYWAYTIIISYILYRFFEKPSMRLRERFAPFTKATSPLHGVV